MTKFETKKHMAESIIAIEDAEIGLSGVRWSRQAIRAMAGTHAGGTIEAIEREDGKLIAKWSGPVEYVQSTFTIKTASFGTKP